MRISPNHILCAVDFSGFAPMVLAYGKALAREYNASLSVCHVIQDAVLLSSHASPGFSSHETTTLRLEEAAKNLRDLAKEYDIHATPLVALGHAADEIVRLARTHQIDLVIAATHGGSGIKRFLVGSVTARLVKILECPLMVLHPHSTEKTALRQLPLKRVLVGCDFSPGSKLAFDYALSLAQEFEAEIHLVHVIKPYRQIQMAAAPYLPAAEWENEEKPEFRHLKESAAGEEYERRQHLLKQIEKRLGAMVPQESRNWCTPVTHVRQGEPYQELINYARVCEMDMMVLGIHGHSLLEKFLVGSTTERVLGRAECPVLAVRQPPDPGSEPDKQAG